MPTWTTVVALTLLAGLAMPLGATLASVDRIRPGWLDNELRHTVIAFGGGALLRGFGLMAPLDPAAGLAGHFWLSDHPRAIGAVMVFAAGGILYLISQDIAPQAKLRRHWAPPLGAVAGFLLGVLGDMLVG